MPSVDLPPGRYLSCAFGVAPDMGGQTRALLMRNRFLAREGGVRPDVLTLGPGADYEQRREVLLERGLLDERLGLLNIYDHYREHGWGEVGSGGAPLADLATYRVGEQQRPDGSPWRVGYRLPGASRLVYDYLRAGGSPYLRIPDFSLSDKSSWRLAAQQVGPGGTVVGEFSSPGQFFRHWIRELAAGHDRAFVFLDSRFVVPHLVPMRGRRFLLLYQMHNMHLLPPRRWDSEVHPVYARVLARIDGMDAMVNLTERQRDDIAARRGRTTNMFVAPNPIDVPEPPAEPPPRDPRLVVTMARLETQKRLTHAIAAFQQVVEALPDARLEIYGEGSQRARLESEIERRGLGGSVTLRGFDPAARDVLWRASAFLLTSEYEGYPLATLESMSHRCPVVSYDVRYGPREQITDGVDGFVVPEGDLGRFAERVTELLRSPELVARMGEAGRATVARYGPAEFTARWAAVLDSALSLQLRRTRLESVELELTRLRVVPAGRLARVLPGGGDFAPGPVEPGSELELAGVLRVEGKTRRAKRETAELTLAAIHVESGEVTGLPLAVEHVEGGFALHARVPLADVLGDRPGSVRMRLRLTWQNSAWQTEIARPPGDGQAAVSFGPDGVLELTRS